MVPENVADIAFISRLSELLGVPVPALPSLASNAVGAVVSTGTSSFIPTEEIGGPGSLWIDEEDKKFYEDLRDLSIEVPANFLGIAKDAAAEAKDVEPITAEDDVQTSRDADEAMDRQADLIDTAEPLDAQSRAKEADE